MKSKILALATLVSLLSQTEAARTMKFLGGIFS